MLKSMSIHQKDNDGIVKSNFVTSCLAFRISITTLSHGSRRYMLNFIDYYSRKVWVYIFKHKNDVFG